MGWGKILLWFLFTPSHYIPYPKVKERKKFLSRKNHNSWQGLRIGCIAVYDWFNAWPPQKIWALNSPLTLSLSLTSRRKEKERKSLIAMQPMHKKEVIDSTPIHHCWALLQSTITIIEPTLQLPILGFPYYLCAISAIMSISKQIHWRGSVPFFTPLFIFSWESDKEGTLTPLASLPLGAKQAYQSGHVKVCCISQWHTISDILYHTDI